MFGVILAFLSSPEGIAITSAVGATIYGWFAKKKIDKRWTFIMAQAPRIYLSIEALFKGKPGETKFGGFRDRMDQLLKQYGFAALSPKDYAKLIEWVRDEALGAKAK